MLEDKGSNGFEVSVILLHGSEVVSDTTVSLQDKLKFRGQVADDAKLQTLEVQDTVFYFVSNSGTIIQALIKRNALIDMHTELWLPEHATVTVALLLHGGVDLGAAERLRMQNDLTRDYDQSFPEIVNRAIKSYRGMETAWQEPGKCATLAFAPASGTLQPLAKGQAGQVTGHVVATSDGGTAKSGRWTVLGARNGTITPPSAGGGSPGFSWTVTNASAGIQLEGDFMATSTAGVATATWSQPTKGSEPPLRIAGNFGGSLEDSAGAFSWSGSVTFSPRNHVGGGANWSYPVDTGSVTVTASGRGGRGPAGCHWQGTRQFNFQPTSGEFHVLGSTLGTGTDLLPPYQYSSVVALLDRLMDVTTDSCDDPTNNGRQFRSPRPPTCSTPARTNSPTCRLTASPSWAARASRTQAALSTSSTGTSTARRPERRVTGLVETSPGQAGSRVRIKPNRQPSPVRARWPSRRHQPTVGDAVCCLACGYGRSELAARAACSADVGLDRAIVPRSDHRHSPPRCEPAAPGNLSDKRQDLPLRS